MNDDNALRQEVIQQVKTLSEDRLQDVLRYVESLHGAERSSSSVEEKIAALVEEEDKDIWTVVPVDGAEHHDHYIYGRPGTGS